jgi:hypothetical protein
LRGIIKEVGDRRSVISGVSSHLCAVNFWASHPIVAMWHYESEGWSLILWILRDINFVGTPHNRIEFSPVFEPSPQPKPETYFVAERYLCISLGPCISACVERGNQIQVCTPHQQPERREPTLGSYAAWWHFWHLPHWPAFPVLEPAPCTI